MGYILLGTELSPKKYQSMFDLFSKDLPQDIFECLKPGEVLIDFEDKRKLLDITILTFWTNNFRRYDWRTKKLILPASLDEEDVGCMYDSDSLEFYGSILGQHVHLNKRYADSIMKKQQLEIKLNSIFGNRV